MAFIFFRVKNREQRNGMEVEAITEGVLPFPLDTKVALSLTLECTQVQHIALKYLPIIV